jgi:hypothetical protein
MRYLTHISLLVSLSCVLGCASRPKEYLKYDDVPKITPYHTDEVAEAVYRMGFAFGYNDFMASHAKRKTRLGLDPPQAERDGYLAGVAAAYDAWDKHWQEYWRTNSAPLIKTK